MIDIETLSRLKTMRLSGMADYFENLAEATRHRVRRRRPPGQTAAHRWTEALRQAGARPRIVTLPDRHDPASWLAQNGLAWLRTLLRVPASRSLPPSVSADQ